MHEISIKTKTERSARFEGSWAKKPTRPTETITIYRDDLEVAKLKIGPISSMRDSEGVHWMYGVSIEKMTGRNIADALEDIEIIKIYDFNITDNNVITFTGGVFGGTANTSNDYFPDGPNSFSMHTWTQWGRTTAGDNDRIEITDEGIYYYGKFCLSSDSCEKNLQCFDNGFLVMHF